MDIRLIRPVALLALLLVCAASRAGDLCDAGCELTIDFIDGGRITAIEALTITFGDGGLVDTGGSVTAYLENETLALNAGDSLEFGPGGSFDIGAAGNIAYTDLEIDTDGTLSLGALGGTETIQIPADGRLILKGSGSFTINSQFATEGVFGFSVGTLELAIPHSIPGGGSPAPPGSGLTIGSGTLSLSGNSLDLGTGNTPIFISNAGSLSLGDFGTIGPGVLLDPVAINGVLSDPLTLNSTSFDPVVQNYTLSAGTLTLTSSEGDSAAAIDPTWLLLLTLAGLWLGRTRPRSRLIRIERHPAPRE